MRPIDADRLKRKLQKVALNAWKLKIKASVESIMNQFIDWINEAPTIEPELTGWIPCKDRLPKDEEEVIVSIHDDSGDSAFDYSSSGWYAAAGEFWVVDNEATMRVTAWMPLPHPYHLEGWKE